MTNEELARKYQKYGDAAALQEIISNFDPLIKQRVSVYGQTIPAYLLEPEAKILLLKAVKSYDESKGTLSSHINNYMQGLSRVVNNASPVYVPQARVNMLKSFEDEQEEMTNILHRPPTYKEMSDKMSLSVNDIIRLGQETKRTLITGEELPEYINHNAINGDSLLEFVYNKLSDPGEKKLLEMIYGMHGVASVRSNNLMAAELNVSETTIRNMKDKLIEAIKEYE